MQVSVETTGNIDRKMTVEVPADRVGTEVEKRLQRLAKKVRIDGFRPGKVPLSVVRKRYQDSTRYEVIGDVIESTFRQAAQEQKLRVVGLPDIAEVSAVEADKPITYVATFQIYPEFTVADVSTLTLVRPVAEVSEADLDKMIDVIRQQQQEWEDVDRPAQTGDMVRINFEGSLNGELFEGGSAEDFTVTLGAGRMLPDFEAALVGMSAGEEKLADVAFPADYQAENLAGQTAQFKLKVNQVQQSILPEVNEAFIERFGLTDLTVEAFRAEVKKNMQRELGNAVKAQMKQQVMEGLARLHDIGVPRALVASEVKQVREEFTQNTNTPADNIPDALFTEQATRRVKLGLIVGEVIRQHNIQRDPQRVEALLQSLAMTYEEPEALLQYYRSNREAMQTIEAAAMEELIVEWVTERATVNEEQRPFEQVMGRAAPTSTSTEEAPASVA